MPPQNSNESQPAGYQPLPQPSAQPQPMYGGAPQQNAGGQYQVLPTPAGASNNGHSGHNPYEFIVNPNTPTKGNKFSPGRDKFMLKIGLLVGGLIIIMLIVGFVVSLLAPKGSTPGLTAIAQRQQEIVRISTAVSTTALGNDTRHFASTTQEAVTSDQLDVIASLKGQGIKLNNKTLALGQDHKTDTVLSDALTAGTYDKVAAQTLQASLQTYEDLLQTTFKDTSVKTTKALLQRCYDSAEKLVNQAKTINGQN